MGGMSEQDPPDQEMMTSSLEPPEEVRVVATYRDADGNPLVGQVSFTAPTLSYVGGGLLMYGNMIAELDEDAHGVLDVNLVASNDPNINPSGWQYAVVESFRGIPDRTYHIATPRGSGTIELLDVAPPVPPDAAARPVLSVNGVRPAVGGDVTLPAGGTEGAAGGGRFAVTLGAAAAGAPVTVSHGLGTVDVVAAVRDVASGRLLDLGDSQQVLEPGEVVVAAVDDNTVTVTSGSDVSDGDLRLVLFA